MSTMFEAIRIGSIKGVRTPVVLTGLGKVNVLCGKNNSGKTTLLEGINQPDKGIEGRKLSADDIAGILKIALRGAGWSGRNDPKAPETLLYQELIRKVAGESDVWYGDEGQSFAQCVNEPYQHSGLQRWQHNEAIGFTAMFANRPATVLLPPKRELQSLCSVNSGQTADPKGNGILDHLFYAKNRPSSDADNKTYQLLSGAFQRISGGYSFDVFLDKANHLNLNFSPDADGRRWFDASNCGLGLQDLIVILFFALSSAYGVVLVEEPESHLHPELQKRLLLFLRQETDKQFFVSTHSNVFLNSSLVDKVFFTSCDESVEVSDATSRSSILNDLGYSVADNLVSDLVILVEGPTDIPVVEDLLLKYGLSKEFNIKAWPMGGDIMDQLDLSVFKESHPVLALIDKDPGSSKTRARFKAKCAALDVPVTQLERYSIENYFTLEALRKVFGKQIPESVKDVLPDKSLEEQIGFSVKGRNRAIIQNMSVDDLKGTDLAAFFSEEVARLCRTSP